MAWYYTLLNNQWIKEETKFLEANEHGKPTCQNLLDVAKAVLRWKFIAVNAYTKKQEISQINNIILCLKELEKEEQTKPQVSGRREVNKIKAETNEMKKWKTIEKINQTKFFE